MHVCEWVHTYAETKGGCLVSCSTAPLPALFSCHRLFSMKLKASKPQGCPRLCLPFLSYWENRRPNLVFLTCGPTGWSFQLTHLPGPTPQIQYKIHHPTEKKRIKCKITDAWHTHPCLEPVTDITNGSRMLFSFERRLGFQPFATDDIAAQVLTYHL